MIQAFSLIFNFFNIASPCGDMKILKFFFHKTLSKKTKILTRTRIIIY
jgi:hypothetical protein